MAALGPHAGFILAAYAAGFGILAGLVALILADHRARRRELDRLEPNRRSGR